MSEMKRLKYWQGINRAMAEELERDDRVVVAGEDVGKPGGTYIATKGLFDRFGPDRVRDTPISEATLIGLGTGSAMTGLRPIIEIMFFDFFTLASDQLVNHAAKVSMVSGGAYSVPMVVRTICGARKNAGLQHSQSLEAWLGHVPGLKVVWPSRPSDALGLLKAAVRDPNPVVVIESLALWGLKEEVSTDEVIEPLGKAKIRRSGDDVTLVSWGGAMPVSEQAAEVLSEDGISVELVDLRSINPIDRETLIESVEKTGRLVIAHDAVGPFGGGAEIAALASEHAFEALAAPIRRVTAPFTHTPFPAHLEAEFYPHQDDIVDAVRQTAG